jgi:8-oxo-dGTP pyrophosphatase MutT (NUDIX family)
MTSVPMLTTALTIDHMRAAMTLADFDPIAAQGRMTPHPRGPRPDASGSNPREAGVLALIVPDESGLLSVVLTRRTETLRGHSGQISFPGGRRDPEDSSLIDTALRETCEELGVCGGIEVLGQLSHFYIPPSNFLVYPSVGWLPELPRFIPNADEVAEVFTFPLRDLLDERFCDEETRDFSGVKVRVPFYNARGHKVWGATAVMLCELEHRLRAAIAK